jgi:hypothetical protein
MATVDRDFVQYVLRALEELKLGQAEVRAKLNIMQYEKGLPMYTTPSVGNSQWGYRDEIHGVRADPRRRVEENEPYTRHGYFERTPYEVPRPTARFQTEDCTAKHQIYHQHSDGSFRPCDSPIIREVIRETQGHFPNSRVCYVVEDKHPPSFHHGVVAGDNCCGSHARCHHYNAQVPVNKVPTEYDPYRGGRNDIYRANPRPMRRMEESGTQLRHGYGERFPHEVPSRTNYHITQHNTESPYKTREFYTGRERPSYTQEDYARSPLCPVTDQRRPTSTGQGAVGDGHCCGSCKSVNTQTSPVKERGSFRRFVRPTKPDGDIFWHERPNWRKSQVKYQ